MVCKPEYGCEPDKTWVVLRQNKVIRVTFSKSLADHLLTKLGEGYRIERRTFIVARPLLAPGDRSRSGLTAIVDGRKHKTLRLSLIPEAAELMSSQWRYLAEAWIL